MGAKEPLEINSKREKIKVGKITYFGMHENNIGYIQLL
jgi:hypothetical protein